MWWWCFSKEERWSGCRILSNSALAWYNSGIVKYVFTYFYVPPFLPLLTAQASVRRGFRCLTVSVLDPLAPTMLEVGPAELTSCCYVNRFPKIASAPTGWKRGLARGALPPLGMCRLLTVV